MTTGKFRSIIFELTQRCNHDCLHCYNVWKNQAPYPEGELSTPELLNCIGEVIDDARVSLISLSGGEPLLRQDIIEIIDYIHERGVAINLLTNASMLDSSMLAQLTTRSISVYEIPLLSADRRIHDRMCGSEGAFERVTAAIVDLKSEGQTVIVTFVATRLNIDSWERTAELAVALGADGIMFNRFNPGGRGYENLDLLQCSPSCLSAALDIAERLCYESSTQIACSIPLPPCLIDTSSYHKISTGYCALGTDNTYFTIDPLGNLRPCNHSSSILGNLRQRRLSELTGDTKTEHYFKTLPKRCLGCEHEKVCKGCCRAAAEACFGSIEETDPFVRTFLP